MTWVLFFVAGFLLWGFGRWTPSFVLAKVQLLLEMTQQVFFCEKYPNSCVKRMYLSEFSGFFPHQSAVPTIRLVLTWRFLWGLVPKHGFPNRLGNHPKISQLSFLSFFLWVKLFLSKFSLKHHFISSFTTCLFFILVMAQKLKCLKLESARQLNQPRSSQIPLRVFKTRDVVSQPDESMGNPSPRFSSLWVSEASLRQRPQRARNRGLLTLGRFCVVDWP